ncbi:hypothetical protein ACHWQZ_G006799 [Mnemiopsis leidyi]
MPISQNFDSEEEEDDDDVFTEEMISFAEKAEHDNMKIKQLLRPNDNSEIFVDEKGERLNFLNDPKRWIKNYKDHTQKFEEDDQYIGYVVGLLDIIVHSSPYGEDKHDIYSPILLLQKIVRVKILRERRDPMRTALKLQYHLREYAQMENDRNSIYDRRIEELEGVLRDFVITLIKACVTPVEVTRLMRLDDDTMFLDVLKSKNKRLVASKMYQKVVWQKFWGSENSTDKRTRKSVKIAYALKRLTNFFFWNIFYLPLALLSRCTSNVEQRRKRRDIFFSPFSSYLADLLNYSILIALLLVVTLTTVPNPRPVHLLIHQLKAGNITAENNESFRVEGDGRILVKLSTPTIPFLEWTLWTAIFSRILTEFYQASQKKGSTATLKLKKYINSFSNLNDVVLLLLLLTGMICKLNVYVSSIVWGVFHPIDNKQYVSKRLIFTIYFYSTAAVMALVHLLQISTIHIPGMGPLLRAIRKMSSVIGRVIFLFVFFIVGFIVPMRSMVSCYRAVHGIDGIDDDDDFYSFGSVGNTVLTLVWSMFGGLAYNHKENLYKSRDTATTFFMSFLLVVYAVLLGLMCMNLLIAIMCSAYSEVNMDKFADWRFSQFESIMEYNAVTNEGHGMPFLFPFCIPYIIFSLITMPCRRRRLRKKRVEREKDNHVAQFLVKNRINHHADSSIVTFEDLSESEISEELPNDSASVSNGGRKLFRRKLNKIVQQLETTEGEFENLESNFGGGGQS